MPDKAQVTSIEAIAALRSALINYLAKAKPILEDACDEVFRTREWLEHDRRVYWENQFKKRSRALEEARQALLGAKMSKLRDARTAEQMAVERAKRGVAEAEEKLRRIRRWTAEFGHHVEVLLKELEQLRVVLSNDMTKAVAHLAQVVKILDSYAGLKPAYAAALGESSGADASPAEQGSEVASPEKEAS